MNKYLKAGLTTLAAGFDFSDYKAGDRASLIQMYPDQKDLIARLTLPSR